MLNVKTYLTIKCCPDLNPNFVNEFSPLMKIAIEKVSNSE